MNSAPLVLSVQHFCIHDGPGVRSVVFVKGCPLRCSWCQNPESYSAEAQLGFKAHVCIGCRSCVQACPHGAREAPGLPAQDRCRRCFACVRVCPAGALVRYGEVRTVDEVLRELRPEFPLMRDSGGGVTLSGGEPTMQPDFCAELAGRLRADGLHVAMETCGQFTLDRVDALLCCLDLVLFDLKLYHVEALREHCASTSSRIRSNLVTLARRAGSQRGPCVWPRLPLVPGITDTRENLRAWAHLLREIGLSRMTLVPHHALGASKRIWLGMPPGPARRSATSADMASARDALAQEGVIAFEPGEEDW